MIVSNSSSPNPIPLWRFWVPMLFQTALILTVPAQAVYTQLTGKTVILQTVPINRYELLRGYSQTLKYEISSQENLRELPGWQELPKQLSLENKLALIEPGTHFYIILAEPVSPALPELPQAWKPVAVSAERPSHLPTNQVALKGLAQDTQRGFIEYGLETYYLPEEQREQINADLHAAKEANPTQLQEKPSINAEFGTTGQVDPTEQQIPPVVMEIKVNAQGDAMPVSLWARVSKASKQQVRNYRF